VESFDQALIQQSFENALIQKNNIRWIKQKVLEADKPPKAETIPEIIKFRGGEYWDPPFSRHLRSNVYILDGGWRMGSVQTSQDTFRQVAELLRNHVDLLNGLPETPSECYACKNYSHSLYLKCAVNPARTMEQDCNDFELNASDWDSSEDNPTNYPDWEGSENNPANYKGRSINAPINPMIYSAVDQGFPIVLLSEVSSSHVQENPSSTPPAI
jgi:hypothetical protein